MGKSLSKSRFIELFGDLNTNPFGFEVKKLSEIAEYYNGVTYKPENIVDSKSGFLVLRSSNIQNGQIAFDDNVYINMNIKDKHKVEDNDILMCSRNGSAKLVGKVALIHDCPKDTCFGAFMMIIRSKFFNYLYSYFQSTYFRQRLVVGATSTINQITVSMLDNIKLPIPPIELVNKYTEQVKQIDKSKFILQKMIEKLELLKKSRFIELFGTVNDNVHKYEVCSLGELVDINIGLTHTPKYTETGIPFLSVKDISSGKIDLSNVKFISKEEFNSLPKGAKPQPGDLLFCRVGTLGKPVIVSNEIGDFGTFVSLGYLRFSSDSKVIQNTIKCWMNSDLFDIQVRASISGASQPNLNTGWLKKFKLVVPPIEIQNEFANFVNQIDKSKLILQKQLEDLVGETK